MTKNQHKRIALKKNIYLFLVSQRFFWLWMQTTIVRTSCETLFLVLFVRKFETRKYEKLQFFALRIYVSDKYDTKFLTRQIFDRQWTGKFLIFLIFASQIPYFSILYFSQCSFVYEIHFFQVIYIMFQYYFLNILVCEIFYGSFPFKYLSS